MVTCSKKVLKVSTHSETHQHQSQITKTVLTSKKYWKFPKKSKEFEKNDKVLGDIIKNWEMGLALY